MDDLTKEAVKDTGVSGRSVLRSKNFFALGLLAWLFPDPPNRPSIGRRRSSRTPGGGCRQRRRISGRVHLWRGDRGSKDHIRGQACRPASRHLHQRQWQHRTRLGLIAASKLSGLPLFCGISDHSGIGHPPRAGSSQELRCAHLPGRGRDRRRRKCHRRRLRRGLAVTGSSGPASR